MVYSRLLTVINHAIAPVLVNTAQETYMNMPEALRKQAKAEAPQTVF